MHLRPLGGFAACLFLVACGSPEEARVERLPEGERLQWRLLVIAGARDGDRILTQCTFRDGPSKLVMDLALRVGVPPRLDSGSFRIERTGQLLQEGEVGASELTFLGGQAEGPTIGGVFELRSRSRIPLYRVVLPRTPITTFNSAWRERR